MAVSIGLVGGFIVGLTSVGSGTLFALAMLLAYPLAAKYVVGTDIAHAAALLSVAGVGHLVAGNVDVPAIAWLLVGSIPGVLIGSQISVGLPETALRLALATALALSGLKLLDVPYSNQIVLAALAAGGLALAAWGISLLVRRGRPAEAPVGIEPPKGGRDRTSGDPLRVRPQRRPLADGGRARDPQVGRRCRRPLGRLGPRRPRRPCGGPGDGRAGRRPRAETPKALTDEAVREADVVVTMGCGDACPVYPASATSTGTSGPAGRTSRPCARSETRSTPGCRRCSPSSRPRRPRRSRPRRSRPDLGVADAGAAN